MRDQAHLKMKRSEVHDAIDSRLRIAIGTGRVTALRNNSHLQPRKWTGPNAFIVQCCGAQFDTEGGNYCLERRAYGISNAECEVGAIWCNHDSVEVRFPIRRVTQGEQRGLESHDWPVRAAKAA